MKKDSSSNTSQDYDRKHQHDHILQNPRAAKDLPSTKDDASYTENQEFVDLMAKGPAIATKSSLGPTFTKDKRVIARHEHTNHFTNRASGEKK